jgi:catalase
VDVHNNQRDGHMRQQINKSQTSYGPNTIGGGCPFQAKASQGGFTSYTERIDAKKIRERSQSFFDHFSQARLFFNSQSEIEKDHLINALRFELGKVERAEIRERMVGLLTQVDKTLASKVAEGLGIAVPKPQQPLNHSIPADGNPKKYQPVEVKQRIDKSDALSMANTIKNTIKTRHIAILAANGVDDTLTTIKKALEAEGAQVKIIAPALGMIKGSTGQTIKVDQSFLHAASVLFDAAFIPGGAKSAQALINEPDAVHFVNELYKHCKAIGAEKEGIELLKASYVGKKIADKNDADALAGVIINASIKKFITAVAQHRFWEREKKHNIPA